MTLVICPGISISATNFPSFPLETSLSITTTRLSYCRPTAASEPSLLTENWRGKDPPAGASWSKVSLPVHPSMAQLCSVSEGILVLLVGSKLGMSKSVALRADVRRNFPSG
jgi:hypothetical protein